MDELLTSIICPNKLLTSITCPDKIIEVDNYSVIHWQPVYYTMVIYLDNSSGQVVDLDNLSG